MSHKFMFFLFFLSFFAFSGKEEDQGLFQAAQEGSIEKMAYWIEKGANIHAMDDKRQTPICMLVQYRHTQSACWLLKRYADSYQANPLPGVFELIRPVVQTDNVELFKLLLAYQLIVVASPLLMQECSLPLRSKAYWNNWRYSLLRHAALAGAVSIVEHIYDHHKEAYSDYCWQAAFRLSVKENHIPIVELLLKKGIDINLQTEPFEKYCTLGLACIRGNLTMVQLLLKYGANPNLKDGHGCSGLDHALSKQHGNIAKYLLRLGQRPAFYIYNDLALRNYFIYHNGSSLDYYPSLKAWLHKFLTALQGCWPTFPIRTVLQNILEQVASGTSPKCSAAKKSPPI